MAREVDHHHSLSLKHIGEQKLRLVHLSLKSCSAQHMPGLLQPMWTQLRSHNDLADFHNTSEIIQTFVFSWRTGAIYRWYERCFHQFLPPHFDQIVQRVHSVVSIVQPKTNTRNCECSFFKICKWFSINDMEMNFTRQTKIWFVIPKMYEKGRNGGGEGGIRLENPLWIQIEASQFFRISHLPKIRIDPLSFQTSLKKIFLTKTRHYRS